jgi:hypothetical protein
LRAFSAENIQARYQAFSPGDLVPIASRAEDFMIVVAGGAGKHSCCLLSFGSPSLSVTRPICWPTGAEAASVELKEI